MDESLYTLARNMSTHSWVVAVFLVGFIATLVCSIICTFTNHKAKELFQIVWGMGIFLMALDLNNFWLITFSIVIGGTVVASESFMLKAYSIFRANNANLHAIVAEALRAQDQASTKAQNIPHLMPGEPEIGDSDVPQKKI